MNKQQFISYVQKPEVLSADSAALLDNLVKEYPFFQTAHLLYAKNLFNQNSIQYNQRLKMAAAYSGDRRVLYNLINGKKREEFKAPEPPAVVTVQPVVESLVKPAITKETEQEKIITVVEQKVEKLLDEKIEKLSTKLDETAKIIEQRLAEVEHKAEEITVEQKPETKPVVSEIKPPKDIQLVYSIEKEFDGEDKPPVDSSKISDLSKNVINEAIDASVEMQLSQLMYEENKKKQQEEEQRKAASKKRSGVLDKNAVLPFSAWLKNTKRFESEKEVSRQQIFNIIDEFTRKQETEGIRPKAEFFSPENMAKKSVELDESIITETLAKILVKQKDYNKAIRAYEMLSLKYPEKSAFFAAQILEIKKLKSTS